MITITTPPARTTGLASKTDDEVRAIAASGLSGARAAQGEIQRRMHQRLKGAMK